MSGTTFLLAILFLRLVANNIRCPLVAAFGYHAILHIVGRMPG
jgi:hypothetical protein